MPHLDDLQEDKIGDLTPSVMNYAEAKSRLPDPSYTVLRSGSSIRAVYLYHQDKNDIDDPKAKSGLVYRVNGLNVIFTRSGSLQFGDHAAGLGGLIAGEEPPSYIQECDWGKALCSKQDFVNASTPASAIWACKGVDLEDAEARDDWPKDIMRLTKQVADEYWAA